MRGRAVVMSLLVFHASGTTSPTPSPSVGPSVGPSVSPSVSPSLNPSLSPTSPSASPTLSPTSPSSSPTASPSRSPSSPGASSPSASPSASPSVTPTVPTPTRGPSVGSTPTRGPSVATTPTRGPSVPSTPSKSPSTSPTRAPSAFPTKAPTNAPTGSPSGSPTAEGTLVRVIMVLSGNLGAFSGTALVSSIRTALNLPSTILVRVLSSRAGSVVATVGVSGASASQVNQVANNLVDQANDASSSLRTAEPSIQSASLENTDPVPEGGGGGMSDGATAGIVIGVLLGVCVIGTAVWWFYCRKRDTREVDGDGSIDGGEGVGHHRSEPVFDVHQGPQEASHEAPPPAAEPTAASAPAPAPAKAPAPAPVAPPPQRAAHHPQVVSKPTPSARAPPPVNPYTTRQVGDAVEAQFQGEWFPATISEFVSPDDERCPEGFSGGCYVVKWEEDQSTTLVPAEDLRDAAPPAAAAPASAPPVAAPPAPA
eukprot:Hpha_TRINITY_DN35335_c0_g1::TRINITY_DN35335_c0_g1_i1::g.85089::m.85089